MPATATTSSSSSGATMALGTPTGAPADRFPDSASKRAFPFLLTAGFLAVPARSLFISQADPPQLVAGDAFRNAAPFLRGGLPPKLTSSFLPALCPPTRE